MQFVWIIIKPWLSQVAATDSRSEGRSNTRPRSTEEGILLEGELGYMRAAMKVLRALPSVCGRTRNVTEAFRVHNPNGIRVWT